MIVFLDVCEPQERALSRLELGELLAHSVVRRGAGINMWLAAQPVQPRGLTLRTPPPVGHQVSCDSEHIPAQPLIVKSIDVCAKQPTERILDDVVGITAVTRDPVDVRPQRARRALVEPRKLDLFQRSTYTAGRAISLGEESPDFPLMSPILRDSLSDT